MLTGLRLHLLWGVVLIVAGLAGGCQGSSSVPAEPEGPLLFRDVTAEVDLSFVHDAGRAGSYFMPQIVGSGAAFFDYDQDGQLDLYLVHNGGPRSKSRNRLLHQEKDGRFRDVSDGSGLDVAGFGMGVAAGDVNNDGLPDVLVTQYGGSRLFLNKGKGSFEDVTHEAGLDLVLWGTSAAFVDYDRDGWLDLVVVHYLDYGPGRPCTDMDGRQDFCPPTAFPGTVTGLFHNCTAANKAGRPRFKDVSVSSGLARRPGPGLGIACADFNGDGWQDILIANDKQPNTLWINRHDGTFTEEGVTRGLAYNGEGQAQANMGVALADVDGDRRLDVFITHLGEERHTLWQQVATGFYQDRTAAAGLTRSAWRGTAFGTVMADFDHDGAPDLAFVNGRIYYGKVPAEAGTPASPQEEFWSHYVERSQLFLNGGKGIFTDVSPANTPFCGRVGVYRGLAVADVDNDGALDLLVTAIAGPARLFRNVAAKRGHWLEVRVLDPKLHRDAYGAELTVRAGGRQWKCWLNPAYSFLCSNDPRAHFGLGSVSSIDSIEVLWPDGPRERETFRGGGVDRRLELRRGEGKVTSEKASR